MFYKIKYAKISTKTQKINSFREISVDLGSSFTAKYAFFFYELLKKAWIDNLFKILEKSVDKTLFFIYLMLTERC